MAILKIARMGHPVLRARAAPVDDPGAPEIRRLVDDMTATLADAGGVGLAAPQVHVGLRVMIFLAPESRGGEAVPMTVLLNPGWEALSHDIEERMEACLSLPGMAGRAPRHVFIRYHGLGLDGGRVEREARGLHARIFQHEYDHLDGVLYPQRMSDLRSFGYAEELRKWGGRDNGVGDHEPRDP